MHSIQALATVLAAAALAVPPASAIPYKNGRAYDAVKQKRELPGRNGLTVDLGYEVYEGFNNASTGINSWLGIRFAAPPTGRLRWQPPQSPAMNRSDVIQASRYASQCPQSGDVPFIGNTYSVPLNSTTTNSSGRIVEPWFTNNVLGTEDCLFLNVQSPANATDLPVLVWIHGGGYGVGNGQQDLTAIINANANGFIGVSIQYRLGAFGFLSSDEVARYGTANAGIYDQHMALNWVRSYISLFGGDPRRVTIAGESAGGGAVMLQDMAYGGTQGDLLFQNSIVASPYLPMQWGYGDFVPTQSYFAFAQFAGCFNGTPFGNTSTSIFECLQSVDTITLQQASAVISGSPTGRTGTWAFLPVTDGTLIKELPSQQLLKKQVNGLRMLSGNNANEGPYFSPQNVETEDDFVAFVQATFPLFNEDDIAKLLLYYPSTNASVDPNAPLFATTGEGPVTALNQSTFGTGQQQRAINVIAETNFVCPSYWLAEAYALSGEDHASYKYQFSVPPGQHASDIVGYFGPVNSSTTVLPEFQNAFMKIWGNFIMHNDPSISSAVAEGSAYNPAAAPNPASDWPMFSNANPYQMNLNTTGGVPQESSQGLVIVGPGLRNDISLVNAYTWEGGRGTRCDFWRAMGIVVPE